SVSSSPRLLEPVPTTSCHHRWKQTVCHASSTICVDRKISISGVGAAHTKGASVEVTRSSPLKKSRCDHSVAFLSSSSDSSQSWPPWLMSISPTDHCFHP